MILDSQRVLEDAARERQAFQLRYQDKIARGTNPARGLVAADGAHLDLEVTGG
jgi:hypothetical protein